MPFLITLCSSPHTTLFICNSDTSSGISFQCYHNPGHHYVQFCYITTHSSLSCMPISVPSPQIPSSSPPLSTCNTNDELLLHALVWFLATLQSPVTRPDCPARLSPEAQYAQWPCPLFSEMENILQHSGSPSLAGSPHGCCSISI